MPSKKEIKKAYQQLRICRMYTISNYLMLFTTRSLYARSYSMDIPYQEIEKTHEVFCDTFGMDMPLGDMLKSKQEEEEIILQSTDEIKELSKNLHYIFLDEQDILAFCKYIDNTYNWVIADNILNFASQMEVILLYSSGKSSECNLKDVHLFPPHYRKFDTGKFRLTWREIERNFQDILNKRIIRKARKINHYGN